ncbi:hypothetical protein DL546_002427 [Coniochaeta pulveracea]|uniref:Uncharacterized protein n=1 Tax=Coniochaeta pulveracea TaxID=177199 RepID=A0A420Y5X6_9PEZI|nr:hypothetical protein DL546_002427 [Coniochaeta pulveracea]
MQLISFAVLALSAAGAFALPEPVKDNNMVERDPGNLIEARCTANLPNCQGASYVGDDNCKCKGQIAPCGNWKCGWSGPKSILNCGSQGSGCQWIN